METFGPKTDRLAKMLRQSYKKKKHLQEGIFLSDDFWPIGSCYASCYPCGPPRIPQPALLGDSGS